MIKWAWNYYERRAFRYAECMRNKGAKLHEKQMSCPADDAGADALHDACHRFGGGGTHPDYEVSASYDASTKICDVQFTINETAEGAIVIDVMDAVVGVLPNKSMPSYQFKIKVSIVNNSPNAYVYQNNGLAIGTNSYTGEVGMTEFVGYDGNTLPLFRISGIAYGHPAMVKLFGKKLRDNEADYNTLLTLFDKLGTQTLSEYFLDYYRDYYKNDTLTWDELMGSAYRDKLIADFNSGSTNGYFSGLFTKTNDRLSALEGNVLDDFAIVVNSSIQFKWPDKKLAEYSYNALYQDLLSVVFGTKTSEEDNWTRDYGVGDYLDKNGEAYTSANTYLNSSIGDNGQLASDEEGSFEMTITLEGAGVGNMYTYYEYSSLFNLTLQFIPATTDIVVSKEWDDANDKDGSRPDSVTVQLYANGDKSGEPVTLDNAGDWKHTFNVPVYSRGEEITYTVEEAAVNGYTATVTGNAADGFVITNSHEPENVVDVPIDVPETGDPSHMMLWLALACLSLCGMAVVLHRTRKEN